MFSCVNKPSESVWVSRILIPIEVTKQFTFALSSPHLSVIRIDFLFQNKRTAQKLMIGVTSVDGSVSRTINIPTYESEEIGTRVWTALLPMNKATNSEDWWGV